MPLTIAITPKELERQAALAFQGKSYKVMLAYDPNQDLSIESTTAAWNGKELPTANGYIAVTGTIAAGSYNTAIGRFELPTITAQFTGSGTGYIYDTLVVVIDSAAHPHSVTRISPEQGLLSSQSRSYLIRLVQDD
jgi:hypothetical protein